MRGKHKNRAKKKLPENIRQFTTNFYGNTLG
jgi:hypothetical protein